MTWPAAGADPGHRGAGAQLGAERAGGRGQRLGDPAHPAAREPPGPGVPVRAPDVVMQHHVRRAGRSRARPGADHARHRQQPAHRIGLEVPVQQVGDASGQQPGDVHRPAGVQLAQVPQQHRLPGQVGRPPGAEPRRDLLQHRPQHLPDLAQMRLVPGVGRGVGGGDLRDLFPAGGRIVGQPQVRAVSPGREIRSLWEHVVSVPGQPQVGDKIRRQERNHVRQRGHQVVGTEGALADRGASQHVPPLADEHVQPVPGQVRGGDQAVMSTAHHYDIAARTHEQISPCSLPGCPAGGQKQPGAAARLTDHRRAPGVTANPSDGCRGPGRACRPRSVRRRRSAAPSGPGSPP